MIPRPCSIPMRKYINLTALMLFVVVSSGCAEPVPKVAKPAEGRRTRLAAQLEQGVEKFRGATHTVRGLAWVDLDTSDEDWKTEAAIAVRRPDLLRIDVMDALADVWAKIGSDGKDMWLYVPGKEKLYKGRASSRNMRRLTSFDSEPGDLVSLISGMPPLPENAELVQVGGAGGRHFVDRVSGVHVWMEKGRKRRIERCARYSEDGATDYEIAFSDYRRIGGVDYPYAIDAAFPRSGARLRIEYRDVVLGGDVPDGTFAPPARRRGKTVRLKDRR
jgi:outer membrane lipoprotein-sorting protein